MTQRSVITITNPSFIDSLDLICQYYLGTDNHDVSEMIIKLNPSINFFLNGIKLNDEITLPLKSEIYE